MVSVLCAVLVLSIKSCGSFKVIVQEAGGAIGDGAFLSCGLSPEASWGIVRQPGLSSAVQCVMLTPRAVTVHKFRNVYPLNVSDLFETRTSNDKQ